ncbi:hypothetical protein ACE1TF_02380 [Geomicrobium sp. JSM 1781026]|uniref:hypothetical protein n=1 Tax=Geomicrobium sp. JSM 1781026 TaxID=3344580 RepID=UPI0035C0A898
MKKKSKDKHSSWSGKQFLLFVILIPGIVLATILAVVFYVLDFNPLETFTADSEEELLIREEESTSSADVDVLEQQLLAAEQTIEALEEELEQYEIDAAFEGGQPPEEDAVDEELARIARIYENMNPRRAADIMSELSGEEIVTHMTEMNDQSRSGILQNMEAELAAEVMTMLSDQDD